MRKSQAAVLPPPFTPGTSIRYLGQCCAWVGEGAARVQVMGPGMKVRIVDVEEGRTQRGCAAQVQRNRADLNGKSFYEVERPDGTKHRQAIRATERQHWEVVT